MHPKVRVLISFSLFYKNKPATESNLVIEGGNGIYVIFSLERLSYQRLFQENKYVKD